MSLHLPHIEHDPTLILHTGQEEQAPDAWAAQYVDVWLLVEVTAEDEAGEPVQAKLIARTTDPMSTAFQQLWRAYAERNILTLLLHSQYSEPQPYVVAYAT